MADKVRDYLDRGISTFERDPPSSDYQRGFLAALEAARSELFGVPPSTKR